jgi:signal transduction histidine kinase
MSGAASPTAAGASWRGLWLFARRSVAGFWNSLTLSGLLLLGLGPVLAVMIAILETWDTIMTLAGQRTGGPYLTSTGATPVVVILCTLLYLRWLANLTRRLAGRWSGTVIPQPYRPAPRQAGLGRRLRWLATDPATWRDLLWLTVNAVAGTLLVVVPVAMVLYGFVFAILPAFGVAVAHLPYVGIITAKGPGAGLIGLALSLAGLWLAPRLLPSYGAVARLLLGPTHGSELSVQVEHLARTRSDTIDAGAAELRRIERDLHDGAQARLVAMGMTLDAIDRQLDADPAVARALLAEAKDSSVKALSELRDLVRGIHPPVLADRGLVEAVRALALDSPLRVHVASELHGRPPAPVESAVYFAVSELLANASKHARPCEARIDFRYSSGMLRISVADDGSGGADQERGTGLRGIEKRLAAFDGVLAVSSPPGGPTMVNLEIPCELS